MKISLASLLSICSFISFTQQRSWDGGYYVDAPSVHLVSSPKYYGEKYYNWEEVINYDIKNNKIYNGRSENTVFDAYDSISRITLERFILDRLNYFRTTKYKVKPLVWDDSLRPVVYHHVVYQRLLGKQTHFERWDVPNFTEMGISVRFKKFCGDKYTNFSEGLLNQIFQLAGQYVPTPTYKMIVDRFFSPTTGLNLCHLHWNDAVDAKWDRVFIYYDFDYWGTEGNFRMSNITITYATCN